MLFDVIIHSPKGVGAIFGIQEEEKKHKQFSVFEILVTVKSYLWFGLVYKVLEGITII